ncbi:MAG: PEP-CTERM sorting domain-containing protein, partial [Rubrivivax sp.]
ATDAILAGSGTYKALTFEGNFSVTSGTLDGVTVTDLLTIASGGVVGITGVNTIDGSLALAGDSSKGAALLRLTGDTTLKGAGSTVLSSKDYSVIGATSSARTLTIAAGHTLRGSGQVGSGSYSGLNVINQGTVIADGRLSYYGSGFDNGAGVVQVAASGDFSNAGPMTGGALQSLGSGATLSGSGSFNALALHGPLGWTGGTFNGVTVQNTVTLTSGSVGNIIGSNTVNGSLKVAGDGINGAALLRLTGDTTLKGAGTTVLSSKDYSVIGASSSARTLTIAAGHTLRGSGQVGSGSYSGLNVVNQGTVIADGRLSYYGGGFDNTAGLIQIAGGGVFSNAGPLSGGTVQGLDSTSRISGSGTYQNLALAGTLQVAGADTVNVSGNLANSGSFTIAGDGSLGVGMLRLVSNTTLSGSGTTVLSNATYSTIDASSTNRTLTIASGHTVRGSGQIGANGYYGINVVNQGSVIADGSLSYRGTSFDNSAGTVRIADGAIFSNAGTLSGGSIISAGLGTLGGPGSFSALALHGTLSWTGGGFDGVTLHDAVTLKSGATGSLSGIIINQGTLSVAGDGTSGTALLRLTDNATLSGNGTTVLSNATYSAIDADSTNRTLTIAAGHTVRGSGQIGAGGYYGINVVNQGTVIADGSLSYRGNGLNNTAGQILIADGALFSAGGSVSGGVVRGLGNGSRITGSGTYQDLTLAGPLRVAASDIVNIKGQLANTGSLTVAGDSSAGLAMLRMAGDTTLSGNGSTLLTNAAYSAIDAGSTNRTLTVAADHTLRGSGQIGAAGYYGINVVNLGTVIADGSLSHRGTSFDNTAGTIEIGSAGLFSASGSALKLGDASMLRFSIGADASDGVGPAQGLMALAGNASFDGRLALDLAGYHATVGDSFTLISFSGARSGTFDNVFATGYNFDVHYNLHDVTVTVASITAVPEPQTVALLLAGLGLVGAAARRRRAL